MFYTGIGSRSAPESVLHTMRLCARKLAWLGYTLRSGGADGADTAFEIGCDDVGGEKEIYLPWAGFNGRKDGVLVDNGKASPIAAKHHPAWGSLKQSVRNLHTRNVGQVLGQMCNTPSSFVLCWTPDGCELKTTSKTGGTGQAIRIAVAYAIPIINMANDGWQERVRELVAQKAQ